MNAKSRDGCGIKTVNKDRVEGQEHVTYTVSAALGQEHTNEPGGASSGN
jgi:hypothetical protein